MPDQPVLYSKLVWQKIKNSTKEQAANEIRDCLLSSLQKQNGIYMIFCFPNIFQKFLRWFSGFQFDSLFPGASSTRRTTALSNVMLIKQIFSLEESSGMFGLDSLVSIVYCSGFWYIRWQPWGSLTVNFIWQHGFETPLNSKDKMLLRTEVHLTRTTVAT